MQTSNQAVIYAAFYVNQDYIAKNLCENRDKPQMHCCGKCCLKKQLAKQAKEDGSATPKAGKDKQIVLFYAVSTPQVIYQGRWREMPVFTPANDALISQSFHSIFRPPQA